MHKSFTLRQHGIQLQPIESINLAIHCLQLLISKGLQGLELILKNKCIYLVNIPLRI